MKIKVCGLKHQHNIEELMQLPINYMGFIFYKKSPRYIEDNLSYNFIKTIPKTIEKVGVFVNENAESITNKITNYDLDIVQLHGHESSEFCKVLKSQIKIIKAFQINNDFDFTQLENYIPHVDYFLFDTATKNYGGSGQLFDWQILEKYNYNVPFFLSGGINENSIDDLKKINYQQLFAIDINSKFETEPGLKNITQIKTFISNLKITT
jgi:phosphoribosylanthranilate isomerase